jgi:hypothetical protein
MRGFPTSSSFWRNALAFSFCLLAFLFALEAKTAWYGPVTGPGCNVRAAKAMPADAPKVVQHGIPTPDPTQTHIGFPNISANVVAPTPALNLSSRTSPERDHSPYFSAAYLSPASFFRPPPIR